jgi:hypothetical protein
MNFRRVDAFDFFFAGPTLGSRACSAFRFVVQANLVARHIEQVLKNPPLTPSSAFLKKNDSVHCCIQPEQYFGAIANVISKQG